MKCIEIVTMSDLTDLVDSLDHKVRQLLQQRDKLQKENKLLREEIQRGQQQHNTLQNEITDWKERCNSLKLANSMLGSDQHKRETKLKINALIREIDHCISQLSE